MLERCVTKAKWDELHARMKRLGIREDDIIEKFILGSGKGGQKINKTASCVYLRHLPTGIEVKCQRSRSRALNRFLARRTLCDKIEDRMRKKKMAERQEDEKEKRRDRVPSQGEKERALQEKHRQSQKKTLRKQVEMDE